MIQQFSLPKSEEDDFIRKMVDLLASDQIGELQDDELFKIILSSFNMFFFSNITSIDVQFTEECNLRCNYCFVRDKRENRFSPEMGMRALDFLILNSGSVKKLEYTFFGGEPLLEFDTMYLVMQYAAEVSEKTGKNIAFNATTNGILLNEDILKKTQGRINYLLSIDGDEKSHNKHRISKNGEGSFKHVFPKIQLLKRFQPWVGARMTICPDTVGDLLHNVDFLYRNGVNQFLIGATIEDEWDESAMKIYEEQYRMLGDYYIEKTTNNEPFRITTFEKELENDCSNGIWGCWAGRNHVIITYNGDIYPCSKFIGLESYNCSEFYLGNIFEGFTNLKARERLYNLQGDLFTKCQKCELVNECSGGCPADNFSHNRDLYVPCNTGCDMLKMRRGVLIDFWEKRKKLDKLKETTST